MKSMIVWCGLLAFLILNGSSLYAQQTSSDNTIYETVDKLPRLKGAGKDIGQYIKKKVGYSDHYKIRGVEGDIWISFVVTALGQVTNVEIEKGIYEELDEQVKLMVSNSGKWKPGEVDKVAVSTQMRLPVRFTLSKDERNFARQIQSLDYSGKRPLFILDNKPVEGVIKLESFNIKSIRVIKGHKAIKLYGEDAQNGVIIMTSKKGTPPLY